MNMKKSTGGFTLIETMIAITILTLSIVGPMITADRAIVAAETARDQLSASYLAQEGIEYMRAVRDDAYLAAYQAGGQSVSATAWNNFLNGTLSPCISPGSCTLGSLQSNHTLLLCTVTACPPIVLETNGTPFSRSIQLVEVGSNEVRITASVSWTFHSTPYVVTITDHLTSWQ